jgi:putative hemolysin
METFRRTRRPIALVMDEYGGVQGLVTTNDLLDALVGDLPEGDELNQEEVKQEGPGVWRVDGMLSVEDFKAVVGLERLPQEGRGLYETVGGLALTRFGDIPKVGDSFRWADLSFVVLRMDGFRVAELRVRREPPRVPGSGH